MIKIWLPNHPILLIPSIFHGILVGKHGNARWVERVVPIERPSRRLAVSTHFYLSCVADLAFLDQVRSQLLYILGRRTLQRHPIIWFALYLCVVCWLGRLFCIPINGWGRIPSELRGVAIAVLRVQGCLSFRRNMSCIFIRCWRIVLEGIRAGRADRIRPSASSPNSVYKVVICARLHPPLFTVKIWMVSTGASCWDRDLKASFDWGKEFGLVIWTRLVDKIARLIVKEVCRWFLGYISLRFNVA